MSQLVRPRWLLGHLLAFTGVVLFVFLGFWQLDRHSEKVELREAVEAAEASDPMPIEGTEVFDRVMVSGEYLAGRDAKLLRSRDGVSGYAVLTPLALDDGSAVLVERGWVPLDVDFRDGGSAPAGVVTVTGILWPSQPAGDAAELDEFIRGADPSLFERALGIEFRAEYLIAIAQNPPFGQTLRAPEIRQVSLGPHLGYAGQWFLFAAVVLVGYPVLIRRGTRSP